MELYRAAEESSDEEGGDSEGHNDDSDVAIDDDMLGDDLQEFVVLATCLYNDRSMHMVDPKLVAAAQAGALGGTAASKDEDESEGDEPPYDLVPMKAVCYYLYFCLLPAVCAVRAGRIQIYWMVVHEDNCPWDRPSCPHRRKVSTCMKLRNHSTGRVSK